MRSDAQAAPKGASFPKEGTATHQAALQRACVQSKTLQIWRWVMKLKPEKLIQMQVRVAKRIRRQKAVGRRKFVNLRTQRYQ